MKESSKGTNSAADYVNVSQKTAARCPYQCQFDSKRMPNPPLGYAIPRLERKAAKDYESIALCSSLVVVQSSGRRAWKFRKISLRPKLKCFGGEG